MLNIPEIIIILVIIAIVFGFGKIGRVGENLGKVKREFKKGYTDEKPREVADDREVIDITPGSEEDPSWDPKPGARPEPVEDAEID